jgi:hypothetical protein
MSRFRCSMLLCFSVLSLYALAQENRIVRVGVATMKNAANLSVPGTLERDRLVAALNQLKPDKKQHIKVQGVPLDGITPDEVGAEAKDKKCDYVVYTTLVELRGATDPVTPRPGTIETNPNGVWNNPHGQAVDPEYRATVEYKLYRAGDNAAIAGAPFSTQEAMPEAAVVSQIMDRIATRVFADVKKGSSTLPE